MMLDDDVLTATSSAAALAAGKTAGKTAGESAGKTAGAKTPASLFRPKLMMLEGDDVSTSPPQLVRQTNGAAVETVESTQGTKKKRRSKATRRKKSEDKSKSSKKRKTKN